uniref:Uncharacterized protein n=1 Tax=Brassica oleracea TaxID=3712 RepID=A0A3P6EJ48_BRAOL|nr:unnamed protein product [Brassica oleracea]
MKHHVNAIIDDDFWQVVKHEKLQEGYFEVKSSMSFGGSHWCRSTSDFEHRSTFVDRYSFNTVDRQHSPSRPPPIDKLQHPSIDEHLSQTKCKPMDVDKAPMGRTLRKRKEKVAKHLKRGANEKEMKIF